MAWNHLAGRAHIQNFTDSSNVEPHWGYADRIVPCTNDAGSCEYLDVIYHSHDLSMLYTGIFWSSILAVLLIWGIGRRVFPSQRGDDVVISALLGARAESQQLKLAAGGGINKVKRTIASMTRRCLLPDFAPRLLGGHVTRLQVVVLLILGGYLTILTFVGIVYKTWITPVKGTDLHNTRSSLGPFADRIGVLAYALTPLSVLLASRESLLSLITGIPYQSFMFLHRWVGYIILIQSTVHTIGWVVIEAKLYQPQPTTWYSLASELYIQWGFVALGLLVLLWVFATPLGIRLTGYEFFRKAHYVLAMVYIGAIIGHWVQLQCFLVPGILLWFFDRLGRMIRTSMLHYQWIPAKGKWGFESAKAKVTLWEDAENGDVLRLDFDHVQRPWDVGQHFFLCFPESSIWQSHPMTPLSLPMTDTLGRVRHSYVIRAKSGETKKIAQIAAKKLAAAAATASSGNEKSKEAGGASTSVILTGPYGVDHAETLSPDANVLCIAGGTGITFVLPVLLKLVRERKSRGGKIDLIWAVRRDMDIKWVKEELDEIKDTGCSHGVNVDVYITREKDHHSSSSSAASSKSDAGECTCNDVGHHHPSNTEVPEARRPHLDKIVKNFVASVAHGSTTIYASGPGGMIGDLRRIVSRCNEAGKVWAGDGRGDVRLVCDHRLE